MNVCRRLALLAVLTGISIGFSCGIAQAEEKPRPYDGLTAGQEAHQYHETRRREQVRRHLETIDEMKWYAGLAYGEDETIYYRGEPAYSARRYWPSRESVYAYGRRGVYPRRGYPYSARRLNVFEPWPFVAGDLWDRPYYHPVPQPIGQRHVQTGPNRWESHPVYAPEDRPAPPREPAVEAPPAPAIPPPPPDPKPVVSGPREF